MRRSTHRRAIEQSYRDRRKKDPVRYAASKKTAQSYARTPRGRASRRTAALDFYHRNAATLNTAATMRRAQMKELIWSHKTKPCADCGTQFPPFVMQFDHVRGVKQFDLSQGSCRSADAVLAEIAKCEVVCANCHAMRTHFRRTS